MNYTTIENLSWTKNRDMVNCVVDFVGIGKIPFTASLDDLPHSAEIYNRCVAGEFGPIAGYVSQPDEGPQELSEVPLDMQIPTSTPGAIL